MTLPEKCVVVVASVISVSIVYTGTFSHIHNSDDRRYAIEAVKNTTQSYVPATDYSISIRDLEKEKQQETNIGNAPDPNQNPTLPGIPTDPVEDDTGDYESASFTTPFDASNIDDAIAKYAASVASDYSTSNWKYVSFNGNVYPWDVQNKNWANVTNTSGESLSGLGCMWSATAAAIGLCKGELYGVRELLTDMGYTVSYNGGNFFLNDKLPCVGNNAALHFANGVAATVPSMMNHVVPSVQVTDTNNSINVDDFNSGGFYVVHCKGDSSRLVSSSGQHWFLVVGYDASNNSYQLACTSHGNTVNKSYVDSLLNHSYLIK